MATFKHKPVPYDPQWPSSFAQETKKLHKIFGTAIVDLHHIGSTAVPGLMAKPVIDILGEARNIEEISSFSNELQKLGYEFKGENGIPERAYFSRSTETAIHLHIFPAKHFQIEKHLLFRDYLLANPDAVSIYMKKKQELLTEFPNDREGYQSGKNSLILKLTDKAYTWAGKDPLDLAKKLNPTP